MDYRDYLTLANNLAEGDTEAEWRSASSRAYYAAFHVASEFLRDLGFEVPRMERAHAYAWLRLSNAKIPEVIKAGSELNGLRSERNHADYDGERPFFQRMAAVGAESAQRIINTLDQVAKAANRSLVTETIKTYERDVLKEVTWKST